MGLNIKFYDDKHKEGEITSVGYIPVDTKARKDSRRLASSGAVKEVEEKADAASAALQEQIDEIAVIRPENDPYFLSDFGKALTSGHPRFTGYAAMAKAFVRMIENEMYANRAYFDDVDNLDVVWPAV